VGTSAKKGDNHGDAQKGRSGLHGRLGRLVRETGRAIAQVAKDPGINACTLGNWGLSNLKLLVRGLV